MKEERRFLFDDGALVSLVIRIRELGFVERFRDLGFLDFRCRLDRIAVQFDLISASNPWPGKDGRRLPKS
jgi:hypothetical protein